MSEREGTVGAASRRRRAVSQLLGLSCHQAILAQLMMSTLPKSVFKSPAPHVTPRHPAWDGWGFGGL